MCAAYQYAQAHHKYPKGINQTHSPDTYGDIHDGRLKAGNMVSIDHFESRLHGRIY